MIFYIIDLISEKINNIKKNHKKNPKKLKIFFIWLTLVILVTIIFYLLGAFESVNNSIPENIPLKIINLDDYSNSDQRLGFPRQTFGNNLFNPLKPQKLINSVNNTDSISDQTFGQKSLIPLKQKNIINSDNNTDSISDQTFGQKSLIPLKQKNIINSDNNTDSIPANKINNLDNISDSQKILPKKISKNNSFRNVSDKNRLYDVVPKNEVNIIDEVLSNLKNISSPHIYQINDYNFE